MTRCQICMKPLPPKIFNPIGLCEECIKEESKDVKQDTHQTEPQRSLYSLGKETGDVNVGSDKKRIKKQIIRSKKNGKLRTQRKEVGKVND